MNCRVLYFARLRECFDRAEELGATKNFRVAVNQELVKFDAPIPDRAEVAIFPPVTGG